MYLLSPAYELAMAGIMYISSSLDPLSSEGHHGHKSDSLHMPVDIYFVETCRQDATLADTLGFLKLSSTSFFHLIFAVRPVYRF